jgi:alkanesulfonate monooxygenase SsuD/methylene tetrahydromethanopterin reductase-like flavin-dependent oxidoreductase (luciferase family)
MQFGTMIINHQQRGASPANILKQFVEHAVESERLGFHSIWTTEHHFASDPTYRPFGLSEEEYPHTDYDLSPDPLTLLTWTAAKTSTLRLGSAVSILHWDHPIRLVERAAMLDLLSDGRMSLGVGRGLGFREADVFGVPSDPKENEKRYHEALEIIRRGWTGEPFSFEGEYYTVPPLAIVPRPERQPAPIVVGSSGHASAIWAAQNDLAYATITWPLVSFDFYRQKRELYLEAGRAAGFDIERHLCPTFLYTYCGESDAEAEDVVMQYMTQFQYINEQHYELGREHHQNAALMASHSLAGQLDRPDPSEAAKRVQALARQPVEYHIVGSPKTCRERVRAYKEDAKANYIVLNTLYGGMAWEKHRASIQRFASEVMPYFKD